MQLMRFLRPLVSNSRYRKNYLTKERLNHNPCNRLLQTLMATISLLFFSTLQRYDGVKKTTIP